MHPNPLFRSHDRAQMLRLVEEIGFAAIFLTTPAGPRVAHAPLIADGADAFVFHLARANALAPHLDDARALMVVQGPHGYISPRWYADRAAVPTWDYVALEMEGTVTRLSDAALEDALHRLIRHSEQRIAGAGWHAGETPPAMWEKLFGAITGFRIQVDEWRPTLKLSQKRSPAERSAIADGLAGSGNAALAAMMRGDAA